MKTSVHVDGPAGLHVTRKEKKMNALRNNRGSVMIFATMMLVLLIIMVGMGLDAGWLAYVRSQGQPAVDSAALAGATGLIVGESEVYNRVSAFNGTNDYVDQSNTMLGSANVTPIFYDGTLISPAAYGTANGVRVALETAGSNPYDGSNAETSIMSPLFLTPLMNLFGNIIPTSADVNVSAVAVMMRRPELPFTIVECEVGAFTASWSQTPSTSDNSAFTSFTLSSANVNTMRDMVSSSCGTIPVVGLESCINLNNGQDTPVLQEMIKAFGPFSDPPDDPDDCFLIPVIPNVPEGGNLNQCRHIQSLARLCITSVNAPGQPNFSPPMTVSGQITDCNVPIYGVTSCSVPVLVRDTQSGM
jgi:Flp pilus assembly protein TadG